MEHQTPLPIKIEEARGEILNAVERIREAHQLPACIIEGILSSVLVEVRGAQKMEIINAHKREQQEMAQELEQARKAAKAVLETPAGQETAGQDEGGEITEDEIETDNRANTGA